MAEGEEPTSPSVWTMPAAAHDPERFPHVVLRGTAANLAALRGTDAQTRAAFCEERNTNSVALAGDVPALLVEAPIRVKATIATNEMAAVDATGVFGDHNDDDDGEDNDENDEDPTESAPANAIQGEVLITNTQVLFVAESAEELESDLAIGGACVVLHAMTEDPEPSIYLQLSSYSNNGDDDGGCDITEVTLVPSAENSNSDDCQKLFDALCKLISLHPVEGDDDDDGDDGMFGGGMIGGGFGDDTFADYGEPIDGLVWAPPPSTEDGPIATNQEREAMLERLDNLLVVPPGLEAKDGDGGNNNVEDGQFEDATEP